MRKHFACRFFPVSVYEAASIATKAKQPQCIVLKDHLLKDAESILRDNGIATYKNRQTNRQYIYKMEMQQHLINEQEILLV